MIKYTISTAEDYVNNLYRNNNIFSPSQLNPESICECLNKVLVYLSVDSVRIGDTLYLDKRLSKELCWQVFGHELCHLLWHHDNQLHLSESFIAMQERDANNFAYYACVPTCMLVNIDLPNDFFRAAHMISDIFNVTPKFAKRRLEMHLSKMYQATY